MPDPARKGTLADALAHGPMGLEESLARAVQLAVALRELHAADRAHGRVSPGSIVLKPSGIELLPSRLYFDEPQRETDVRGWGTVLYEMVTGSKPQVEGPFGVPKLSVGGRSGPSGIRPAAQRLAMKCLTLPPHALPTMQQVLSEVRLLAFLARQYDSREEASPVSPPPVHVAPIRMTAVAASPAVKPKAEPPPDGPPGPGLGLTSFGQPAPKRRPEPARPGSGPCPRCNAAIVYVSRPRSVRENRLESWGIPIWRCYTCYH